MLYFEIQMELTFDDFLSNRIGLGKAQYIIFLILSMVEFMEGFQEIFVGILVKILTHEWSLSERQQMLLGSVFFGGVLIGNCVCSLLADQIGRKVMLIVSQALTIVTILMNSYAIDFLQVLGSLFAYGLLFGISMPISQVMISEVVPVQYRGRYIVLLQFIYIVGILYLIACCFIFLDSFESGDWRSLLRFNTIPAGVCLLGSFAFLKETPRLIIAHAKYEEGFAELDRMGKTNNPSYKPMTDEEKQAIQRWRDNILKKHMDSRSLEGLLKGRNLRISLTIWGIFIFFNMISSGMQIITPYIMNDTDSSFWALLFAYAAEIPAIIFVVLLIDNEQYGGRIRSTVYGLVLLTMVQVGIFSLRAQFIVLGQIFMRFAIRVVWSCLNALPAESYSTVYRSMGVGVAQGLGKGTGTISPFPMLWLYYQEKYLPFLVSAGISLLTLILVFTFPVNATLKPLDRKSSTGSALHDSLHNSQAFFFDTNPQPIGEDQIQKADQN